MKFTNEELSFIQVMLEDMSSAQMNYPNEWTPEERDAFDSLSNKFHEEFKAAGFWWAR
jgi:hypothetical protein